MSKQPIPLTPCKSSQVLAHGFDPASGDMAIAFKNGVYHYHGVTPAQYEEMTKADSIGSHVHKNFVATKHKFTKQEPPNGK